VGLFVYAILSWSACHDPQKKKTQWWDMLQRTLTSDRAQWPSWECGTIVPQYSYNLVSCWVTSGFSTVVSL